MTVDDHTSIRTHRHGNYGRWAGHRRLLRDRPILTQRSFRPVIMFGLCQSSRHLDPKVYAHIRRQFSVDRVPFSPHCFSFASLAATRGGGRVPSRRSPAHGWAGCPEPTEGRSPGRVPADALLCRSEAKEPYVHPSQAAFGNTRLGSNALFSRSMAKATASTLRPTATIAFL